MRVSLSATVTAVLLLGSVVSGNVNAEPKPDTTPDQHSKPTKTARQAQESSTSTSAPNLLSALYQLASSFDLRACVPAALPLITTLPKIPPALIAGDAVSQALSQTTRGLDGVCDFSITGGAGDAFTSFLPTWYSWYGRYSERVATVVTKCPKAGALVRTLEAYETCPQVRALMATATATTGADGAGGATDATTTDSAATPETTSADSPGAAHETGLLGAAAAAAAGVLGIVAVL